MEFKGANKNQLEAINYTEGQLLIIAGPGTGKTKTLIDRTLNLIVNKKVDLNKGIIDSRTSRNVGLFIELLVKFEYLNKLSVLTIKNIEKMVNRLFDNFFKFLMEGGISNTKMNLNMHHLDVSHS